MNSELLISGVITLVVIAFVVPIFRRTCARCRRPTRVAPVDALAGVRLVLCYRCWRESEFRRRERLRP